MAQDDYHKHYSDEDDPGIDSDAELADYLDPYSNTMALPDGPGRLIVDVTKFFDSITEQLERVDMDNEPIGLSDVADRDVWFSMINSGWAEQICGHLAATAADIVHRRYPAAAVMPVDDGRWIYLLAASVQPPFEWSYPGDHLNTAATIMAAYLRNDTADLGDLDLTAADPSEAFKPLYRTVKSMFELAIAVIGAAKQHPLYHAETQ